MLFRFRFSDCFRAPKVNPVNNKALTIPVLNPFDQYGRVFFFSWFGFMVAFWAWYTFPPLLSGTIKPDLHLTSDQVANSNIISILAALLIRTVSGPLCDRYGPRVVFGGLLLVGSIPLGLAPLVHNAPGLYASRFFIGMLGGTFVPCQVWTTGFFDKSVVGTANALTGGFGNAGGGVTYFIMPAVFDSLHRRLGIHATRAAWRLTFVVPLIVLLATAVALLLLCPDTPTGPWKDRPRNTAPLRNEAALPVQMANMADKQAPLGRAPQPQPQPQPQTPPSSQPQPQPEGGLDDEEALPPMPAELEPIDIVAAREEIVVAPTAAEIRMVLLSPCTWALMLSYMCSFGTELVVDGILGTYYRTNFPELTQTKAASWAAMFGFLNLVARPLGGFLGDLLFRLGGSTGSGRGGSGSGSGGAGAGADGGMAAVSSHLHAGYPPGHSFRQPAGRNLWRKKLLITGCGLMSGLMLIVVGQVNPRTVADGSGGSKGVPNRHAKPTMFGLIALLAIFLEAGNGATFALVPHVHPFANGVVSGLTGAAGNLGGIFFSILFRFTLLPSGAMDGATAFWIMGIIHLCIHVLLAWIPPIPSRQVGGR